MNEISTLGFEVKASKKDQAYKAIKEMIVTGKLAPNMFISERLLSDMIGVSRTPIKAALNELNRERLVVEYPGRGFMVGQMSIEDLTEIYEIRCALEPFVIKKIVENDMKWVEEEMTIHIERMRKALDEKDFSLAQKCDMAFHDCYFKNTRNDRLQEMLLTLRDEIRSLMLMVQFDAERQETAYAEHMKVLECIRNRDAAGSGKALKEHLLTSYQFHMMKLTSRSFERTIG